MENYKPVFSYPIRDSDGWKELTGELPVRMTNDYLFRALLQSENDVLKSIIASVLHRNAEEIKSAEITNPILLGESIEAKAFVLDVSVDLNHAEHLDLEMQVVHEKWWTDRSLSYICRSFDQLNRGMSYEEAKAVRQIAFCDFTLFEDDPEFCATYKILNERNPRVVYSDKFIIINVDLTRSDLANEEDRKYGLDRWAKLFKAETWEDLKMLAEEKVLGKAISASWQLTEEEMIQAQCRAREDWLTNDKWKNDTIEKQSAQLKEKDQIIMITGTKLKNAEAELTDAKARADKAEARADTAEAENDTLRRLLAENGISVPDNKE